MSAVRLTQRERLAGFAAVFGTRTPGGPTDLNDDRNLHCVRSATGQEWFTAEDCATRHRVRGPAEVRRYSSGGTLIAHWLFGELHRTDGPAHTETFPDGQRFETWYRHGVKHRDDGPAEIAYDRREVVTEVFYTEGNVQRLRRRAQTGELREVLGVLPD